MFSYTQGRKKTGGKVKQICEKFRLFVCFLHPFSLSTPNQAEVEAEEKNFKVRAKISKNKHRKNVINFFVSGWAESIRQQHK